MSRTLSGLFLVGALGEINRPRKNWKNEGDPFPEINRGFWCLVSTVDFFVDFFVNCFGPSSLEKQARNNPLKIHQKNPRSSRELLDQNPLREIPKDPPVLF